MCLVIRAKYKNSTFALHFKRMLFNSIIFAQFFVGFYLLYLVLQKKHNWQNVLVLVASYVFYGYWDWRFLFLIALSTLIDFTVGLKLHKTDNQKRRKRFMLMSVAANLGMLGVFKYFNFFADSFVSLFNMIGFNPDPVTLNIILPVGISFYTFQTMSYTIDIYRGKLAPTKNIVDFAVFVSFFPQLVAGPIERAVNLLPQVQKKRIITPETIQTGIFLIVWGYFKKVVIADNCGVLADEIFNNYTEHSGIDLMIAVLAFSFQIYGDFSGYSDIARGISKLLGFELMLNFRLPYFAINPSDFWNRWHISLSSWLRDYLYIPLGGNKGGKYFTYRNLFLTMLLGGLWHGAAWNFVIWGAFHGLILIIYRLFDRKKPHLTPWDGSHSYLKIILMMVLMFILTQIGWLIFRARSAEQIWYFFANFSFESSQLTSGFVYDLLFFITPLLLIQIVQYIRNDLNFIARMPAWASALVYSVLIAWAVIFGVRESTEFIYFQF